MQINQVDSLVATPTGDFNIPALSFRGENNVDSLIHLSLVIPTYKERDNIKNAIASISQVLDEIIPGAYEVIVVDDDSPDGTWEVVTALIPEYPHLRVMRRQHERGLSTAVIRGWQIAQGDILGVIDGDLQHPPQVLLQLLAAIQKGSNLAVASRHIEGGGVSSWSFIRRFLSRGAQLLGLAILPEVVGRVSDPMSGYFLVRRNAIANTSFSPIGYKILLEVIGRGQVKNITEVGYVFFERKEGESKVTWKQYVEYIQHLVRLRLTISQTRRFNQYLNFPFARFVRFGLVGLSGVFVDMLVLYLLSDPATLSLPLTRSKIIAAEIAIVNNFLWNDAWTFADVAVRQQKGRQRLKRFLKFNMICLSGLVLNVVVLNIVFNFIVQNRYIANLIAIAITTIWNFWANLKLSWRVTEVK